MKVRSRFKTWGYVVIGTAFLSAAAFILIRMLWHPNIEADARNAVASVLDNNPDRYYEFAVDFNKEQTGLSRQQFRELWQKLIWPRFSKFKVVENSQSEKFGAHQAVAWVKLEDSAGHQYEYNEAPFASDNGSGKTQSLMHPLLEAWILEFVVEKGKPVTTANVLQAYIDGCTVDRATLHEIGADLYPSADGLAPARTWEQMIALWRGKLQKLSQKDSATSR
jgi:hypothetical protein